MIAFDIEIRLLARIRAGLAFLIHFSFTTWKREKEKVSVLIRDLS